MRRPRPCLEQFDHLVDLRALHGGKYGPFAFELVKKSRVPLVAPAAHHGHLMALLQGRPRYVLAQVGTRSSPHHDLLRNAWLEDAPRSPWHGGRSGGQGKWSGLASHTVLARLA